MSSTDRIERKITIKAPRSRVWRALTDYKEFNTWFRVNLDGPFVVGKTVKGNITSPGYEYVVMEASVEKMEPETYFSYRWHPYSPQPEIDYPKEPKTLVEFHLEEVSGGTVLTVVESGFDQLPAKRYDEAFRMNSEGWTGQMENIQRYVAK